MTESESLYLKKLEKELRDLKEQYSSLHNMYEMTTVYLKKVLDDLTISEQKLKSLNKNLTDSINYAKHIQDAFITNSDILKKLFKNSFIFHEPKDIVSGDFTWTYECDNSIFLAVGDCTGHGVPGAMLSIFIITMLNLIVNNNDNETPADILDKLDKLIQEYLSHNNTEQNRDSAEIVLIKYDKTNSKTLCYSGAKRPLVHIRNGITTVYNGARFVLGNNKKRHEFLENKHVNIQKNDMIFMFSDGFADQFGGENFSKFTSKKLLDLLQSVSNLTIDEQYEQIKLTFANWKGEQKQIDDVLVLGIRV